MKKMSFRAARWYDRRSRAVALLQIRAARYRNVRRRSGKRTQPPIRILAPKEFLFLNEVARDNLFRFLSLVDSSLQTNMTVVIDFGQTELLHPCGTLIFMSHLDSWLAKYPGKLRCTYPKDEVSEELLQHVSVLSRLGLPDRRHIEHERVKYWHYHCGTNADSTNYKTLTKSVREGIVHPAKELFADCLNEAVVNTVGHAYKFEVAHTPPKAMQKWWMFSLYKDELLFVAIYDQGVGIPRSLKSKPELSDYLRPRNYNDSRLIQAAIGSPWTSTKMPHRGKGLPEMLEFSQNLKHGGLSIWSQHGGVIYNADVGKESRHKLRRPLPGTLVLWSIPFRKEQENANENDINS